MFTFNSLYEILLNAIDKEYMKKLPFNSLYEILW